MRNSERPEFVTTSAFCVQHSAFCILFGLLVLAQAAHSLEEYFGRLWESFPPATFVAGLVSEDRQFGFLLANVVLVTFGVWCYLVPVRRGWRSATAIATVWAMIELVNGIGHPLWSLRQRAYTPGVATAPILFVLSIAMFSRIREMRRGTVSAAGPPRGRNQ